MVIRVKHLPYSKIECDVLKLIWIVARYWRSIIDTDLCYLVSLVPLPLSELWLFFYLTIMDYDNVARPNFQEYNLEDLEDITNCSRMDAITVNQYSILEYCYIHPFNYSEDRYKLPNIDNNDIKRMKEIINKSLEEIKGKIQVRLMMFSPGFGV